MTEERKEDLIREWDYSDQLDDSEYQEWYEGLTQEEQSLIDKWDKQYMRGVRKICEDILKREGNTHE